MQPTPRSSAWSAWAGWATVPRELLERRRVKLTVHQLELPQLRRDWQRPHPVYTPEQLKHLLRLENAFGWWSPSAAPDKWRSERRPQDLDPNWRLPDFIQNVRLDRPTLEGGHGGAAARGADGGGAGVGLRRWDVAAQGWAAGAVLLAAVLLLVRALEHCLDKRLLKGRRRPSEEWPTPNVLATSQQYGNDIGVIPHLDDSDGFQSEGRDTISNDLPPPYSECANVNEVTSADPNKPPGMEEPPPPYSACYFTNPKDGVPTVHFYSRSEATSSREVGNSSTDSDVVPSIAVVVRAEDEVTDEGCETNSTEDRRNQREITSNDNVSDDVSANTSGTDEVFITRRDTRNEVRIELPEPESSQDIVLRV